MPTIWRLNIKTGAAFGVDPRRFCIDHQILGIGWPVNVEAGADWDAYYRAAEDRYYKQGDKGWWPAINAIKHRMQVNDLCWTRDLSGLYYLGRIKSEWRYENTEENKAADVLNVRDCDWKQVGPVDAVPGKVINSFIPSRTVQRVDSESAEIYSAFLYNSLSSDYKYSLNPQEADLLSLISSEDCEDLIGLFLQEAGYRLIASSCKASTAAYEFVMKHRTTGESVIAQVKQGEIDMDISDYSSMPCKVFLFTTRGQYIGSPADNVVCVQAEQIRQFIHDHTAMLSDRIKKWMSIAEHLA